MTDPVDELAEAARTVLESFCSEDGHSLEATRMKNGACTTTSLLAVSDALSAYDATAAVREAEREVIDYVMSRPTLNFTFEALKHTLLAARKALEVKHGD